jgi:hypothetical protein
MTTSHLPGNKPSDMPSPDEGEKLSSSVRAVDYLHDTQIDSGAARAILDQNASVLLGVASGGSNG